MENKPRNINQYLKAVKQWEIEVEAPFMARWDALIAEQGESRELGLQFAREMLALSATKPQPPVSAQRKARDYNNERSAWFGEGPLARHTHGKR